MLSTIDSKFVELMWESVERAMFFVMLDIKNNYGHRLLFNRIKHKKLPGKSYINVKRHST